MATSNVLSDHPHRAVRTVGLLLLAIAVLSGGCATRNVISDGDDRHLMLRGNDPVAYFTEGRAVKGRPDLKADHEAVTYRFASEGNRSTFIASPDRYVPAYGGVCSNGANYALKTAVGADTFKVYKGRLYMFGGPGALKHWEMDPDENIRLADGYWNNEMKDTPNKLQNLKRWVFRVPHYKSDAELEAMWQARQKGK